MNPKVSDIIGIINKIAPLHFAEDWDNPGLQIGDPASPVARILISLDACVEAIEDAVEKRCQLLLTHHPLVFHPLKRINLSHPHGRLLKLALKNDLSIVSLHTNYDIADAGINDLLAGQIGLHSCVPVKVTGTEDLVKLVVFVPRGHEEKVMEALFRFSGFIGNYSDCSFQTVGTGSFKPLDGANPFIGKTGTREYVEESRIEVLLRKDTLSNAVSAMLKAHPYEEPAFDLFPLLNKGRSRGLGRVGLLEKEPVLEEFAARLKEMFSLNGVRVVGDGRRKVRKVAVCGGSGASLVKDAVRHGADVLVTGDIKYHDARNAEELGLALVDIGHFGSEIVMVKGLWPLLEKELVGNGFEAEIMPCETERDPFVFL